MGRQQLLLIVLGIITVLLAINVGMNLFSQLGEKNAYDSMAQEAIDVAAKAFAWRASPRAMSGGRESTYLDGITAEALGYERFDAGTPLDFHDSDAQRWIRGEDTRRPYVQIRSISYPDLMVQSHVYGADEACMTFRTIRKLEGFWVPDGPIPDEPAGCPGWR
ncbi:MAG: hypothetical protein AAGG50_16280 [Bacteroidota bacterium]